MLKVNASAGAAQTTNLRSAPASDGRSTGIAGLGGFGLPELERMAGGVPDPSFLNQLLQNPAIMQMMQSLLSNPQFMNQVCVFHCEFGRTIIVAFPFL